MQAQRTYPVISKGFTLIELMIAMAIGMFLMAGVFTVFSNGRVTQIKTEDQSRMIDDARFAIDAISYDLRHAGLWGSTNSHHLIRGALGVSASILPKTVAPDPMPAIIDVTAPDCGVLWYTDLQQSIIASNDTNLYPGSCISTGYVAGTDVLVTKYASPTRIPAASLADDVVYTYANAFQGELFVGKTAPTFLDLATVGADQQGFIYRLKTRVYYIDKDTETGDSYPSLHRLDLDVGPKLSNVMLLPGIEDFQVQYGVDTNNDGSVNTYVDADDAQLSPELETVKAVQFWVRLRSRDVELLDGETQTMNIAGRLPVTFNDGYRRIVMSTVVKLRNRQTFASVTGG